MSDENLVPNKFEQSDRCDTCINTKGCPDKEYSLTCQNYQHNMDLNPTSELEFDHSDGTNKIAKPDYLITGRPIGELVEEFAAMRDMLKDKRRDFKEFESNVKSDMEELEVQILEKQRELGLTSISTGNYTAFQTKKTFVRMGSWDKFSKWVLKTGNIQCLEKRCAKLACLEIEEGGKDLDTIGIDKTSEVCVQVRKK